MRRGILALALAVSVAFGGPTPTPTPSSRNVVKDLLDGLFGGRPTAATPAISGGPASRTPFVTPVPSQPAEPTPQPTARRGDDTGGSSSTTSPVPGTVGPSDGDPGMTTDAARADRKELDRHLLTVVSLAGVAVLAVGAVALVWYVRRIRRRHQAADPDAT